MKNNNKKLKICISYFNFVLFITNINFNGTVCIKSRAIKTES